MRLQTHNGIALFDSAADGLIENGLKAEIQPTNALPAIASALTQIAADELSLISQYQNIDVDQWVIFPDGLHALIHVKHQNPDGHATSSKPRLLTSFVARFKAATAKRINLIRNQPGSPVWQRSYKEQLVQDELTLSRLRKRIIHAEDVVASGSTLSPLL
ncbi:MAG: hypothetical protein AB8B99_11740 [Phormidesmis sp.]